MTTVQTKSVRRREDVRLLTGGGNYAADGKNPDMAEKEEVNTTEYLFSPGNPGHRYLYS